MTENILDWAGRPLKLEEWEEMPEEEQVRLELVEGLLSIMPRPLGLHQRAAMRLGYRVDEQLPADLTAVIEVEVVITDEPLTIRVPDVLVTRSSLIENNATRLAAADVLLVVEILSDGSRKVDGILKFADYAVAQIPQYWIIDLDAPPSLRAFTLVGDAYELSGEFTSAVTLDVAGHPVTVDPAALTHR